MPLTKIIVWCTILVLIAYDIIAALRGWLTISESVRQIDRETGTLVRWLMLGLWLHFFCPFWFTDTP